MNEPQPVELSEPNDELLKRREIAERDAREVVESYRVRLAELGVLDGLSDEQQSGLADIVACLDAVFDFDKHEGKPRREWRKIDASRTPTELRRVQRRVKAVQASLDGLRSAIERVGVGSGPDQWGNVYLARYLTQLGVVPEIHRANDRFDEIRHKLSLYRPTAADGSPSDVSDGSVWLHDFLTTTCGLQVAEAQVRIAKIDEAFFGRRVAYTERYDGADRLKGSDAVRKRVARRRQTPDT